MVRYSGDFPSFAMSQPSVWDLPPLLMWMLGYTDMGAKKGRDTLIENVKKHCQGNSCKCVYNLGKIDRQLYYL